MNNSTNTPVGTPRKSPMTHLPPAKKGRGAKARVMWLNSRGTEPYCTPHKQFISDAPVLVIPLGEVGELELMIARAITKKSDERIWGKPSPDLFINSCWEYRKSRHLESARAALECLGLPRARLGKGRK